MKEPKYPIKPREENYENIPIESWNFLPDGIIDVSDLEAIVERLKEDSSLSCLFKMDCEHEKERSEYYACDIRLSGSLSIVRFDRESYQKDLEKYEKDMKEYPLLKEEYDKYLKNLQHDEIVKKQKNRYEEYLRLKKEFEFIEKSEK